MYASSIPVDELSHMVVVDMFKDTELNRLYSNPFFQRPYFQRPYPLLGQ